MRDDFDDMEDSERGLDCRRVTPVVELPSLSLVKDVMHKSFPGRVVCGMTAADAAPSLGMLRRDGGLSSPSE